MFNENTLKRINELAKKNKEVGLTEDELKERDELRKIYLENFRGNFRATLDNVKIVHSEEEYEELVKAKDAEKE